MSVALVHDYLNQLGGAERVFAQIARAYPDAPIYTSLHAPEVLGARIDPARVRTSFLQRLPYASRYFRFLAPFYPAAFESFDLSAYDVVVSSTTAWAKGVRTPPRVTHVCYINTVSRFTFAPDAYIDGLLALHVPSAFARVATLLKRPLIDRLTAWDRAAATRPTAFIANSRNVAARVREFYGRDAAVLPCPVDVDAFAPADGVGRYALVVSRLLPYKRVDIAIEACAKIGMRLKIIGRGPAEARLRELAKNTATEFLGAVDDATRARELARARCVILPAEEDFGLVPIEAAASGRPCVAYGRGGALETILPEVTGRFFPELDAESLAATLRGWDDAAFSTARLRAHAETFAPERFIARLRAMVDGIHASNAKRNFKNA